MTRMPALIVGGGGGGIWRKVGKHLEKCLDRPKAVSWSVFNVRAVATPDIACSSVTFS
jgi:hypothetical protein